MAREQPRSLLFEFLGRTGATSMRPRVSQYAFVVIQAAGDFVHSQQRSPANIALGVGLLSSLPR
jgi:hypothetical protein